MHKLCNLRERGFAGGHIAYEEVLSIYHVFDRAHTIEAPWQTALLDKTRQIPAAARNVGLQIRLIGVRCRMSHRALSPMKTTRACCMRSMNLSRPDSIRRPLGENTWASPPPTHSTFRKADLRTLAVRTPAIPDNVSSCTTSGICRRPAQRRASSSPDKSARDGMP